MWFSGKQKRPGPSAPAAQTQDGGSRSGRPAPADSTRTRGSAAERLACDYLTARGLHLLQANFRGPGRGGGEIDLVMRAADGTLVFVEVRRRRHSSHGAAGASIGATKQAHLVRAAQHYLARLRGPLPPCRFDAVLIDGDPPQLTWLPAAFTLAAD